MKGATNGGAERFGKAIQDACEAAIEEPMDDRPTFIEMVGLLEFHKQVWVRTWMDKLLEEEEVGE